MPRPSRRRIPAGQLAKVRAHQAALLDALAERTLYASRLTLAQENRDKTLAELEASVGAGYDLTIAELRLVDLLGVETARGDDRHAAGGPAPGRQGNPMTAPIPSPDSRADPGAITEADWLHLTLWNANAPGMVRLCLALAEALDICDPAAGEFDPTRRLHCDLPGDAGLLDLATELDPEPLDTLPFGLDAASVIHADRPTLARQALRVQLEAERFVLADDASRIAAAIAEIDIELDRLYDEEDNQGCDISPAGRDGGVQVRTAEATAPVFDGLGIIEHAQRVAESVRAINHLSLHPEATPDPAVIYRVGMDLHIAAARLRQAFDQLDRGLAHLARTTGVAGCNAERGGVAPLAASFAAKYADALFSALQTAAQYLGSLSLRAQIDEPDR